MIIRVVCKKSAVDPTGDKAMAIYEALNFAIRSKFGVDFGVVRRLPHDRVGESVFAVSADRTIQINVPNTATDKDLMDILRPHNFEPVSEAVAA